jgi:hypothetical protein
MAFDILIVGVRLNGSIPGHGMPERVGLAKPE